MGGKRVCEVCGIRESRRGGFFASFPLDENRCRTWVKMVGKEDLVYVPIEKLHKLRSICGDHFNKKDFNKKGNRLKKKAVPKLHLFAQPLADELLREFPLHVASKTVLVPEPAIPGTSKRQPLAAIRDNTYVLVPEPSIPGTSKQQPLPLAIMGDNIHARTSSIKRSCEPMDINVKKLKSNQGIQVTDLTEKEKTLLQKLKKTKATLRSVKDTVKQLEQLKYPMLKEIIAMALKNRKRKPRGCRWSTKYKISCLAIFKRSPKVYRYLQHLLPLPTTKTMTNILKKIPMETGINNQVLEHLCKISKKKNKLDKCCCLLFDEIALKPKLQYSASSDLVEGYTDLGSAQRSSSLADHALVLMIQGLRQKFKQPLAYYFVKGTVSSNKLASIILECIDAINKTGFNVMATVCDQGPTNMGALKILKQLSVPTELDETVQNTFDVQNKKVYIVFDVPHLFKSIRNNFLNYGELIMDGKKAKWLHLKKVEEKNKELLYLSKITETHVQPKYRAKMKVKFASQLLSNTVAAVLKLMALSEPNMEESNAIMQSGEIIHDLDHLFDVTNGPSGPENIKRGLRENVSAKTNHLNEWAQYRKKMETLEFVKVGTRIKAKNVRCVQGYIITLCSLRDIWNEVQKLGFSYLNLRQLNQDALENLFGVLRQHSPTNSHPTCTNFIGALKTSVISGLSAPHSRGSNCQKDDNNLMTDFHSLVFENINQTNKEDLQSSTMISSIPVLSVDEDNDATAFNLPEILEDIETDLCRLENQAIVYVSGYIASCVIKIKKCTLCENAISVINPSDDPVYNYIKLREWWSNRSSLTYPSVSLCRLVESCVNSFETDVIPALYKPNICNLAVTLFMTNSDSTFLKCKDHSADLANSIYKRLAVLLIRRQCQRVNQSLSTHDKDLADKAKKAQQFGVEKQ